MKVLGRHVLTEFSGCNSEVLKDKKTIKDCMEHATRISGAVIVQSVFHFANSRGVSGVVVSTDSHLAIHTWPEYGYAAIDLFTYSEYIDPWKVYTHLKEKLGAGEVSTVEMKRGQLDLPVKEYADETAEYLRQLGGVGIDH